MSIIIINLSMSLAMIFIFLTHPLSLGFILLIQTILIALLTGMMSHNFWFSYILFLIMIGGMLILFIYMTSIASNEKFKFSKNLMILFFISTMPLVILLKDFFFFYLTSNLDLINQMNNFSFNFTLNKFINWPQNMMFMIMIIYLLITLIMVTKITDIKHGPLRQKI
uniref:NADH-ubiquinone oxidoreductase chain 6 n=1 Tax=Thermistis croceocincta TaxID=2604364 RepID=A0A5B9RFN5_9CUCU|nr:NADH dehydrogenase subunit 6 [Thermistis croceocincta]QEG58716.1 NADH dehydrogenase subunit 6 [Thermistis croceocincta]